MDLKINDRNISELNKEKRTKSANNLKKKVLSQNNCKDIYCTEESEEEFEKLHSFGSELKRTEEPISKSFANNFNDRNDFENSYKSNKLINEFIQLFSKTLKFNQKPDWIHDRYDQYSNQSQSQKDLFKTDYTYAHSFSYKKYIDPKKIFDWVVPNMSRRAISSVKSLQSTTTSSSTVSISQLANESSSLSSIYTSRTCEKESADIPELRRSKSPMFTRSQCMGGSKCLTPGCLQHKRRKSTKPKGVVIPNSGHGLEPGNEFSEDDECSLNNQLNNQRLTNIQRNGFRNIFDGEDSEEEEEEEEEITIIRRVTNICRTTINNTSRIIDSITPNTIKRVANRCPSLWLLLSLLLFFVPLIYVMSQYKSSLWSEGSLESLTGDVSSKHAINQLIKEINDLKYDLRSLKDSNNELKHKMKSNDFDENEKFNNLNNKMDSIEDYLTNIMKNCCRNETDSMLALIDWRLSAFMASMLTENQNSDQSMTPSAAAQELKAFIRLELSKTDNNFKESVEQKLMSTIERVEHQMSHKSDHLSSNITIDEIKSLISEALAIYDADKTGQPDFALEPAGGTIINTRCSETFDPYGVQYKIFGMPVWSSSISPRAVIQPTISPGECWAFKGANGYLAMKLSQPIVPSAFSYEHIPKQISRDGNIDSAPKEFQVRGLEDESDTSGHLLGNYVYEDNGRPMQYFEVQDPNPRVFQFIELVILSNHGHNDYTCLYRFRVHGKRTGL